MRCGPGCATLVVMNTTRFLTDRALLLTSLCLAAMLLTGCSKALAPSFEAVGVRELERDGYIPGAFHAPRGMIEFWVDPDSPYFKDVFSHDDKTYVLYCAAAWRSALTAKTLNDMGMENVVQFADGFKAWKEAGGPVAEKAVKDA